MILCLPQGQIHIIHTFPTLNHLGLAEYKVRQNLTILCSLLPSNGFYLFVHVFIASPQLTDTALTYDGLFCIICESICNKIPHHP